MGYVTREADDIFGISGKCLLEQNNVEIRQKTQNAPVAFKLFDPIYVPRHTFETRGRGANRIGPKHQKQPKNTSE
jgi:hypothetical protein